MKSSSRPCSLLFSASSLDICHSFLPESIQHLLKQYLNTLTCGRDWTPSGQPLLGVRSSSGSGGLLSLALHFAAGLLLTNCLCHWLPEVQEELAAVHTYVSTIYISTANIGTLLLSPRLMPLPEVILLSGFFLVSLLEEVLCSI